MSLKIGIIGPTNLDKLSDLTGKPVDFFLVRAQEIGRIIAESGGELFINADKGMTIKIAQAYKENKGKKLTIFYPEKAEPWPDEHIQQYKDFADEIKIERDWFWANYGVVSFPDICICVGLSAGTLSELAYIKWNCLLKRGNLKKLIVVKDMVREGRIPPEIEVDIGETLHYVQDVEGIKDFL